MVIMLLKITFPKLLYFISAALNPKTIWHPYISKVDLLNLSIVLLSYKTLLEEMVSMKQIDYMKFQRKMKQLIRKELIILDDFLLHTISEEAGMKVLYELLEKRSELSRSTIICSQREPKSWTSMMLNDEVSANAIESVLRSTTPWSSTRRPGKTLIFRDNRSQRSAAAVNASKTAGRRKMQKDK